MNTKARQLRFVKSMGLGYVLRRLKDKISPTRLKMSRFLSDFTGIGVEFGGPSPFFSDRGLMTIYSTAAQVDNVTFSSETRWEGKIKPGRFFRFHPKKLPGNQYISEGNSLSKIKDEKYAFLLSCHMLEHTANPFKALHQWKRILKTGGKLLLILPERSGSFDRFREVTTVEHMLEDYKNDIGEDDTTHFAEILIKHDLTRDPAQVSKETFHEWILNNKINRGAHHHVFDSSTAIAMVQEAGFKIVDSELAKPYHICILAEK